MNSAKPVVITGAALGGSVASLFTLWLLETINPRLKFPLCITFGSPLIGDTSLQQILENSVRESCFLHVADSTQCLITAGFKPFGTFLICFDSECISISDPQAVVELLVGTNTGLVDYGEVLRRLDQSVLSMADPMLMIDDVINRMEERAPQKLNPYKELNNMKISMVYIEWYIKASKKDKIGYYDQFKSQTAASVFVKKHKSELNWFWKSLVEEIEKNPQSDLSILRRRVLFSGNNYRRIIEPLDIAEYYSEGGKDYRILGRSRHYVMLQKWFEEESLKPTRNASNDLSYMLTYDSCFWAEVEEAMIVINQLKIVEGMRDKVLTGKLKRFEEYVWEMIQNREVSPQIFFEKSSFMKWWKEYKEISSSPSYFTEFMNTGRYKSYGLGDMFNSEGVDALEYEQIQGKTPLVAHFHNSGLMNEGGELPPIVVDGNSENLGTILTMINRSQPSDMDIVGIWGMAGIGKTSTAREIFGILAPQYDQSYCLQNFYQSCQEKGLRQMRDVFYSQVFGGAKLSIGASDVKPSFMRDLFLKKKILILLDDVTNARDAEYVVGGFGWFSRGHRIILTSRRKQVLVQCKVEEPYEVNRLCEYESLRLCKQYLNGEKSGIISELMSCSSGIPLVLQVLGSSLSKQHVNDMMVHLQSLRINPPTQIREAFLRSFDGLDENEKNIFLDLACFFEGEDKDHVVQLLDPCGFFTCLGICNLVDESLISLLDGKIEIPIPFQDMGRFIVREEDRDPCKRSRLWDVKDIVAVLTKNSGTEAIEGIFLDTSDLTCDLSPTIFCEMDRLRLLKFYCSTSGKEAKLNLPDGLDILPDELRLLHWEHYPLKFLPQQFEPDNLVEINMPQSSMEKLWEEKKNLEKLKKIKLSHSTKLTDIVMLSEALNLEHIDLEGCTSLVDISTSIPRCGKLVSLNMKDCSRLLSLPSMVDLTHLKLLNLSGCSELEEIQDFAPNLKELFLAGSAITKLPLAIANLSELVTLDLENCTSLQQLPMLRRTIDLNISGCKALASPSQPSSLESVPKHKPLVRPSVSNYKAGCTDSVRKFEGFLTLQPSVSFDTY